MTDVDYSLPRKRLEALLDEVQEHLKGIREWGGRIVGGTSPVFPAQVSAETVELVDVLVTAFLKAHEKEVKALAPEQGRRTALGGA